MLKNTKDKLSLTETNNDRLLKEIEGLKDLMETMKNSNN